MSLCTCFHGCIDILLKPETFFNNFLVISICIVLQCRFFVSRCWICYNGLWRSDSRVRCTGWDWKLPGSRPFWFMRCCLRTFSLTWFPFCWFLSTDCVTKGCLWLRAFRLCIRFPLSTVPFTLVVLFSSGWSNDCSRGCTLISTGLCFYHLHVMSRRIRMCVSFQVVWVSTWIGYSMILLPSGIETHVLSQST